MYLSLFCKVYFRLDKVSWTKGNLFISLSHALPSLFFSLSQNRIHTQIKGCCCFEIIHQSRFIENYFQLVRSAQKNESKVEVWAKATYGKKGKKLFTFYYLEKNTENFILICFKFISLFHVWVGTFGKDEDEENKIKIVCGRRNSWIYDYKCVNTWENFITRLMRVSCVHIQ